MKINKYTILIALIPFLVDFPGIPAWSTYPVVILFATLTIKRAEIDYNNVFAVAMLLLVVTGLFRIEQYNINLFKDLGLMAIGISPFVLKNEFKVEARSLNVLILIGFVISIYRSIFNFTFSLHNFINSTFGIERGASTYVLGLFSIYWMMNKNLKWSIINFCFMFLGGKRIAMASIGICLLAAVYFRSKEDEAKLLWKIVLAFGVLAWLKLSDLYVKGEFNKQILEYTEKSADAFFMGRQHLWTAAYSIMPDPNYWGVGPGGTIDICKSLVGIPRIHNDFLKIYIENGLIIGVAWLYILLRKLKARQIPTLLFIFALFTTSNTMIYVYMLFMFCMFLYPDKYFYIAKTDETRKRKR